MLEHSGCRNAARIDQNVPARYLAVMNARTLIVRRSWFLLASCALLLNSSASGGPAQTVTHSLSASGGASQVSKIVSDLTARQQDLRDRIAVLEKAVSQARASRSTASQAQPLTMQLDLLKYLTATLAQQQTTVESTQALQTHRERLEQELDLLRTAGLSEQPPYSFVRLEELRDRLSSVLARQDSIEAEIAAIQDLLRLAREKREERERQRRLAKETLDRNQDSKQVGPLTAKLEQATLVSTIAFETIRLHSAQLEVKEVELGVGRLRREYLEEQIRLIAERVTFSESDLQAALQLLDKVETELKRQVEAADSRRKEANQQWLDAKGKLAQFPDDSTLEKTAESWQIVREACQRESASLNQRLAEVAVSRLGWEWRYALFHDAAGVEAKLKWRKEVADFLARLHRARHLAEIELGECQTVLVAVQSQYDNARREDPALAASLRPRVDSLQHVASTFAGSLLRIEQTTRLIERLKGELAEATQPSSTQEWLSRASTLLPTLWNYEITSVDDDPITTREVAVALALLLIGFFASRAASRAVGRRLLPRFGLADGDAAALQTIGFYLLFTVFGYFSLDLIGVPLTIFAFMGGAVAIGVGFGSQNILNNFISGIILLFERPIREGDLVNIDGLYGNIERVGARSTRVRTGSNLEIIVPNSKFLENNVTNLTLSDERIRAVVHVGVAYGSPTRTVAQLLEQTVAGHPQVLANPEPIVLFKDFGNDALQFEVHFWIRMRTMMQGERIESEIRHRIDEVFGAAEIVIAFPQRDVHLDASAPIEVRVQPSDQPSVRPRTLERAA